MNHLTAKIITGSLITASIIYAFTHVPKTIILQLNQINVHK